MQAPPATLSVKLQRAVALHRQGQLEQARAIYEEILLVEPRHFDALHLSGVIAIQTGDSRLAVELIGKAIAIQSHHAEAHCNCGSALEALQQWDDAIRSYDRAIAIKPLYADAHFNRGNLLQKMRRLEDALASFDQAIALKDNFARAYFNRGNVLRELGRLGGALESFDRAIALEPGYAEAHFNRALVLKAQQNWSASLASYDAAIRLKPRYAEAYSNRGNVLKALRHWDAALASYDRAIAIKGGFAEAHFNRGVVLHELARFDAAIQAYDQAISARSDYAEAFSNRGNALTELNRLAAAIDSYDQAIAINPDYAEAYFNRAIAALLAGEFDRGLVDYEWRWKNESGSVIHEKRTFAAPLWLGDAPLTGRSILIHGEQGLGDTIQFCRYSRLLANLGAKVVLEAKQPLVNLLATLEGASQVVAKGDALPDVDYQCPLMSLPLAFKTRLETIPAACQYLFSDIGKLSYWQTRLGERTKPRIGLVWSGNINQRNDHKRSIALAEMMRHFPDKFDYFCLQKDVRESDRQALQENPHIFYFADELDFDNTAALCDCMDLVISVDTSVAHLSAALGRKIWILLPKSPDWRWLLDRDDSPWYPSATLYRQRHLGDWSDVLQRVNADLMRLFESTAVLDAFKVRL
jgi:tetratricopeptide (TPR) repeat protein